MECRQSDQFLQSSQRVPQSHQDWKNYQELKRAIRHGQVEEAKQLLNGNVPVNVTLNYSSQYLSVTPLHLAVHLGNLDFIRIMLDRGASVNAQDATSETPLMLSVRLRKYSVTDLLLTNDSIQNLRKHGEGLNHLHIACLRNNVSVVKKLIALGADVNETVDRRPFNWVGYTPLHFAVESHSIDIVQLLVDNGANVMKQNAQKMTPLHLAHEIRNETIIDILLTAEMFELGNPTDRYNLSHFHISCTRNNVNFVEHFLEQGVDIDSEVSENCSKWPHYQPLLFAIYHECSDVVELLLRKGARTWSLYLDDRKICLRLALEVGNEAIIDLLSNGKAVESRAYPQERLLSEFQIACMKKDLKNVERLLSSPEKSLIPDLNMPLWNGAMPLHLLVDDLSREMIESFRKSGADFSTKDARGLTPLHILFNKRVHSRQQDTIPLGLFDFKKNPSDHRGLNHFHIACTTNNVKLIARFLENGTKIDDAVSVESLAWSDYTALHLAVEYQQARTIDFLLRNDAKISLRNGNGLTPFDLAIIYLHEDFSDYDDEKDKFRIIKKFLVEGEKSNSDFDRRGFSLLHVLAITGEKLDNPYFLSCLEKLPEGINQAINFPRSEYHGCTALHFAMRVYNYEIGKWLIKRGADIYLKDNRGLSPFQYEIDTGGKYGIIEENPDILCVPGNPFVSCGNSYFHIACLLGNRKIMEYHLASGVDVDIRTVTNLDGYCKAKTPLHLVVHSARTNAIETLEYLLNHGANVNARDAFLKTPLHYMDSGMTKEMAELLLTSGAEINAQNHHGNTPLHSACRNPGVSTKIIHLLVDNGADVNIENAEGETPLTYVVELLMASGYSRSKVIHTLIRHVKKLTLLGLHVSHKNEKMFIKFFENYALDSFDELQFEDECFKEIRMMRGCTINQYTTVCSVISKSLNEMAYLSQNSSFREFIESNHFASDFPIYGYLIKLQYKRGLIRKPLLEKCKLAFNSLARLSTESIEKILEYLDNDDLKHIIESEKIAFNI